MNSFLIFEEISPYDGDIIRGVEFDKDAAETLYNKLCEEIPNSRVYVMEFPVGELFYPGNIKPIFERKSPFCPCGSGQMYEKCHAALAKRKGS